MTVLCRLVLGLFALGAAGAGAELLLLEHTEDRWQLVPLILLALGLFASPWLAWRPSASRIRLFRLLMFSFVASGITGVYLHYRANEEFELEMYPSLEGFELVGEALSGALPVLAPATMLHLGLLGLASTFRYSKGDSK